MLHHLEGNLRLREQNGIVEVGVDRDPKGIQSYDQQGDVRKD